MKNKRALIKEVLIMLVLLGGGGVLVFIDCFKQRATVINMGVATRLYTPTILSGLGIAFCLMYSLYLVIKLLFWGFAQARKDSAKMKNEEAKPKKKKNGLLAAALNLLLPGAGHMYCGRVLLGIIVFSGFIGFGSYMVLRRMVVALLVMWAIIVIDGFVVARSYNKRLDKK